MKFYFLSLLACCITIGLKAQQDSQFTQYIFNGLHINPAYAGTKGDLYVQSFYRAQWQGIKGAPKTFSIAADDAFKEGKVGLGMIISNDQIGAQSNLSAFANYAYHLNLNDNELSINRLQSYNSGSHEISVGFYINKKENRKDYRRNRETRCYDF